MVFGFQELKNQLEATCEERDFFQSKYLEQMQELKDLRKALQASQREIKRLRKEIIIVTSSPKNSTTSNMKDEARQADDDDAALTTSMDGMRQLQIDCTDNVDSDGSDEEEEEELSDDDEEDMDENAAIRECASNLLEWVDHRQVQQD